MFRSASGPGLSISTSAANAFGSGTNNPPPSGGASKSLFGTTTSSQPQTSSLFTLPQAASSTAQQPHQANQQSNIMNNQVKSGTNSFFGASNAQTLQPQQGGGLFGSTFGQNQTQPAPSSFGTTVNSQAGSNLFGGTQTQGAGLQQPARSLFSTSIGQQSSQASVPGVRISVNELRPTTRFNDLHEELQKVIESVDNFILSKTRWQQECYGASEKMEAMCQQLPPDVEHCNKSLETVQQSLENDASSIAAAKKIVKDDATDAQLSFKVINNLKLPQQFHHTNLWGNVSVPQQAEPSFSDVGADDGSSRSLIEYFSKQSEDLSDSLNSHKRTLAEVESYLRGMELTTSQQLQQLSLHRHDRSANGSAENQIRELAAVLREFENGILGVATQVGAARESTQSAMLGSSQSESWPKLRGIR